MEERVALAKRNEAAGWLGVFVVALDRWLEVSLSLWVGDWRCHCCTGQMAGGVVVVLSRWLEVSLSH